MPRRVVACFVSWCAGLLGYIDAGVIPRRRSKNHVVFVVKHYDYTPRFLTRFIRNDILLYVHIHTVFLNECHTVIRDIDSRVFYRREQHESNV
jgi:hypothetical protein